MMHTVSWPTVSSPTICSPAVSSKPAFVPDFNSPYLSVSSPLLRNLRSAL